MIACISGIGILQEIKPPAGSGIKTRKDSSKYSEGAQPTDRGLMDGPGTYGRPPCRRRFEKRKWYGGRRYHLHRIRRPRERSRPHGDGGSFRPIILTTSS